MSAPNIFCTSKRQYRVAPASLDGEGRPLGWEATYRPLHPRTRAAWQAARAVPGWNAYLEGRKPYPLTFSLKSGQPPAWPWPEEVASVHKVFASEADAFEAVRRFDPEALPGAAA